MLTDKCFIVILIDLSPILSNLRNAFPNIESVPELILRNNMIVKKEW